MSRGPSSPALHGFAVATAAATFVLLFLGGLVTSTGSALAVPDWPLSFGQVFPEMTGGVLYEHGHRLAASTVGLLTLVLAVWTVLREPRPGVRVLALLALLAVVLQGVLGGVTVLYKLPTAVSVAHACLGQTFFCLTVVLALVTSRRWDAPRAATPSALPALATVAAGCAFVQLVLGATVRHLHAGLAIPDFPLAFGRVVPPFPTLYVAIHYAHRVWALAVTLAIITAVACAWRRHRGQPALLRPALLLLPLVALQILLGGTIVWTHRAVLPTTLHQTTGAAVLGTCVALAVRAWRLRARTAATAGAARVPVGAVAA